MVATNLFMRMYCFIINVLRLIETKEQIYCLELTGTRKESVKTNTNNILHTVSNKIDLFNKVCSTC